MHQAQASSLCPDLLFCLGLGAMLWCQAAADVPITHVQPNGPSLHCAMRCQKHLISHAISHALEGNWNFKTHETGVVPQWSGPAMAVPSFQVMRSLGELPLEGPSVPRVEGTQFL